LNKLLLALGLLLALCACNRTPPPVELNRADRRDLETVVEIGPRTADEILRERRKAEFKDWDDFTTRVKGVGPKTAAKMSADGLIINGQPMPGQAPPAKP
jgi:competence protein ComEA